MLTLWGWLEPVARVLLGRPAARRKARRPARAAKKRPPRPLPEVLPFGPVTPIDGAPVGTQTTSPAAAKSRGNRNAPSRPAAVAPEPKQTAVERYEEIARELLHTHKIRVRKWRTSSSGIAVVVRYRDGTVTRYIESPRPKGPMSMAIFLHEIGHHVLGVGSISPRCLEEYHAWKFALEEMQRRGLNITDSVRLRVHRSLRYAAKKAERRGIRDLPAELLPYLEPPPKRRSA